MENTKLANGNKIEANLEKQVSEENSFNDKFAKLREARKRRNTLKAIENKIETIKDSCERSCIGANRFNPGAWRPF